MRCFDREPPEKMIVKGWFLSDESSSRHFCRGLFLVVIFSLFLIITLKVFLTCSTSLVKIKALGWQIKTSGTLLITAWTARRKILTWRDAHGGHDSCFRAASANLLMYLRRARKSTKLEFRFFLWSHFSKYKNAHGVFLPTGRTVNEASLYFQHCYLRIWTGCALHNSSKIN